jgi:hypothetical protein
MVGAESIGVREHYGGGGVAWCCTGFASRHDEQRVSVMRGITRKRTEGSSSHMALALVQQQYSVRSTGAASCSTGMRVFVVLGCSK